MLRNYLKTAIRSLLRHRFFSAINVFGLAVAMSICMGIIMLVADQLNHDRYNTKSDRIFQVKTRVNQPRTHLHRLAPMLVILESLSSRNAVLDICPTFRRLEGQPDPCAAMVPQW